MYFKTGCCIILICIITCFFTIDEMEQVMQKTGERLAELRKSHKYTQKELAKKLNITQQVISNIERGVTTPDIEQLKRIADVYHISLDQLVGREFVAEDTGDLESQIMACVKQMDEEGKELSLGLVSQVAQHRGSGDGDK